MGNYKGIILAGGSGTRLYPVTRAVSKQLLNVYDKPMVYYPMSVLMLSGIREILLISTAEDIGKYEALFGDGKWLGLDIKYAVQPEPGGLPQAFLIGRDFIGKDNVCLILGDNIFYGQSFSDMLKIAVSREKGATVFAYRVKDPERFGVVEFDKNMKVLGIEEKPGKPKSSYAITGLYFFDSRVSEISEKLVPSKRRELEITDVIKEYMKQNNMNVQIFGRGFAWLDTGTHESLLDASNYVATIEKRQGLKIACLEEISYHKKYITANDLRRLAEPLKKTEYGQYLFHLLEET